MDSEERGGAAAFFGPHEVEVPSLAGLTLDGATEAADEAGFEIVVLERVRDAEVPEGRVVSQDPDDGLLLEGKTIGLVLSKGPPLEPVPGVVGMDLDKARPKIVAEGFAVGALTYEFSVEVPKDAVVATVPKNGKVELGSEIGLVISKGPRSIEVPDVIGMPSEKAASVLKEAGFTPVLLDAYSEDVPVGKVVSTTPDGGATADEMSEVRVAVSIGPEFKEFRLPDVRGMSVGDATKLLQKKGLKVRVVEAGGGGSTVAETDPLAGSMVREGDTVALFVY